MTTNERLAVKSGFMMKRNEQGVWHRKYCCIVPHTFLYYYDSDTADHPRGIIDLELFTNISVSEEGILKLAATDEDALK